EINVEDLGFDHPICSGVLDIKSIPFTNIPRLKVWKSPKYEAYIKKAKLINEGSYICEVLTPLLNIVLNNLPGNPIAWDIYSASARRADYMMVAQLGKNAKLEIVYLETCRPDST
ncbi:429_t:CDS:2, partial [Acaulospora morrowiae]